MLIPRLEAPQGSWIRSMHWPVDWEWNPTFTLSRLSCSKCCVEGEQEIWHSMTSNGILQNGCHAVSKKERCIKSSIVIWGGKFCQILWISLWKLHINCLHYYSKNRPTMTQVELALALQLTNDSSILAMEIFEN